ncbi:SWI/SNF complex subunit SWI3B [Prosopis cineraria]|uniref:SWI/SNF complex subunit SWI3B n=1 Tax=Prosopis cineraria TaxID=364024 RepID=UPI00240F4757|nr:SWI/SNF complex subunit SWI3B [Prosopis cineraria]
MAAKLSADSVETPPPKQVPPEASFADSRDGSRTASASVSASPEVNVIHVPSHSSWFTWNGIHECEVRHLPEFFDSASPSKNPRVYKYYRNSIVKHFRDNPTRKITFTDVRKTLVGDVGSIRRVFDFLEAWGLINYQPSSAVTKPLKWEDKETKPEAGSNSNESSTPIRETSRRVCSGCKAVCTIACFACDKYDLTLCARCYVRGNYRVGVSSSDFRRVEISEETKTDWTDKETLHLLEAIMHYGDDWRRVAQHVGGRTEKDCIAHFIKLPFGEEFLNQYSGVSDDKGNQLKGPVDADSGLESIGAAEPSKRMRLTPLADTSNPIMAQAAFLSALVGAEVAQAAARAAVRTLSEVYKTARIKYQSFPRNMLLQDTDKAVNGGTASDSFEWTRLQANAQLEKEESDLEKAISVIINVQMKNIHDKLVRFEDLDLLLEKEGQQLEQMKNILYVDKLTLLFHRRSKPKTGEHTEEDNIN